MINNKIIVGTMLVSQNADLLDITIPNLLSFCDWCLILMDNESEEVRNKVNEYSHKYYNKIWVRQSSIPHDIFSKSGNKLNYHERWKSVKGVVRNDVFLNLKSILSLGQKGFENIDILLWPDSDVMFNDYLPELLEQFIDSDKKAITMKHIDAVDDMKTIQSGNIGHHVHILKYSSELSGLPRRFFALYHPLSSKDLMEAKYYSVHLAYFNNGIREWRKKHWKNHDLENNKTYYLNKDVNEIRPEEINNIIK